VPENPRIEELRRRIQKDPASIAFAQLAEEYRRGGSYEEAIAACRAGLEIHPGYLSARVTLGRALIEVDNLEAAESELNHVLRSAPENLAAIRGLAEVHHRRSNLSEALSFYQAALNLAKHDPDLEQTVDEISRALTPKPAPVDNGMTFEQAAAEFITALNDLAPSAAFEPAEPAEPAEPPPLPKLEKFLDAIHTYRQRRAV
jgi:tetratricopeptide (TPR) repeat protein